jgi:DEAD/DEAH box helicase domain-containing protein
MLPIHLAENISKQILFYIQSTFDFRDPEVDQAFELFLTDPDTGLFFGYKFKDHSRNCDFVSRQ